ncbi:hypothetical protein NFI96_016698, partial [Prochilodus magdalenae]
KTDTSYVISFIFSLSNISMPDSIDLRNNTYIQVQDSINKVLNTLLNKPEAEPFEPKSFVFIALANQVEGSMEYSFQDGDAKQPISFLDELKTQSAASATVSPTTTTNLLLTFPKTSSKIRDSAVITSRLVFNSSSPTPSESLVLSAIRTLLSSRLTDVSDTKVLNITYQKKTDTSYVISFIFSLSNISMPDSIDLRNNTYIQVQDSINKVLNTLLNKPEAEPFEPKSFVFIALANQVEGSMEYSFQDGDAKQPISFLDELKTQSAASATVSPTTTTNLLLTFPKTSSKIRDSAVITSRLVFNSSSPTPSESLVLSAIRTLLSSRLTDISDTKVLNITYQKKTDTSYVISFIFSLSNISMPDSIDLRNNTYIQVQDSINKVLNMLLNKPEAEPFEPKSFVFTALASQVEGSMEYSFQDGDAKQPISFLDELKTQSAASATVSPTTTTNLLLTFPKTSSKIRDSAVITSRLVFNSSSPTPSESLVLSAIRTLLSSRLTDISDTKVLNITYQKKTDTSYVISFIFSLSNISMPDSIDLRNNTYIQVQDSINKVLNMLLNKPEAEPFEPKSFVFTALANQVEGSMEYSFQDGDARQPISFLDELKTQSAASATVSPTTTTNLLLTFPKTSSKIRDSAVITSRLVFNSSSPTPSESLVLSAIRTLLSSRLTDISDTKVLNITYQKKTDTSYVISFIFSLSNISMPDSIDLRNNTYIQVQDSINKVLNTLLNKPEAEPFEPKSFVFTALANQVEGSMEYSFQDGDAKQPISFLNELKTQSDSPTTTTNLLWTAPIASTKISGSAVVHSRLVFNSSSPVPGESLILNVTRVLLSSQLTVINGATKVLNITYEKRTNTSYAIIILFSLSNITVLQSSDIRNNTYIQVQNSINQLLSTVLNEPDAQPFQPKSYVFTTSENQVEGSMEYSFEDGDTKELLNFLSELKTQSAASKTTTSAAANLLLTPPTTSSKIPASAVVHSRLVFNSSSPVPSESLVLNVIRTLLSSRLTNLSDSTKVQNITYEKKTDTSYVVIFTFSLSNISMLESTDLRNITYIQVQNSVNEALNTILTDPGNNPFNPQIANFTTMGTVLIYIRLVFKNLTSLPSETVVLNAANSLLDTSVRMKRDITMQKLNNPVSIQNITYQRMGNNSYTISFGFKISDVNISSNLQFRNETYDSIQNTVNLLLNKILNGKNSTPFVFARANYTGNDTVIQADSEYVFVEGDIKAPSVFLSEILQISGLASTTAHPPVLNSNRGFPSWALAIIIPFSIAIILIPTWITLCLNTLLNERFSAELFVPQRSNFRLVSKHTWFHHWSTSFQDGDTKTPVSFLNELKTQSVLTTTVLPMTSVNPVVTFTTSPSKISISALVRSRLVFNSSSPVPSESLVINATTTLLNSRLSNLSDSTKVLNFTYEKISDTSYAVIFTFNISNISMAENPSTGNDTYMNVESSVNTALNTLLNEPSAELFVPQRSNFSRNLADQVEGSMEYSFQDGDTKTPVSFLNELKTQSVLTTTVLPMTSINPVVTFTTSPSKISISALVRSRLVFNSSSPVPSESLVINATTTLLNSRLSNLSDSTKVLNFTYEKISDTSYAVIFTFNISNISMAENPSTGNDTYMKVESSVNTALNTLLNEPSAELFVPQRSNFSRNLADQVEGSMEYSFQDGDTKTPVSFLNELKTQSVLTTTVLPMTSVNPVVTFTTSPSKISISALVRSRLVFNSSSPVPSESLVINATTTLLNSRLSNLSDSTKVLNFTYEKISDTSYAVIFTFNISNISMAENPSTGNDTYMNVESSVNTALNTLLNEPSAELFVPQRSNFSRNLADQVEGSMEYSFQDGDTKTPVSFLNELKTQSVLTTTVLPMTSVNPVVTFTTSPSKISISALVRSRLVFNSSSPVPSESLVINATTTLLNSRLSNLSDSTKVLNFTYEKISDTSYVVIFTFNISNISMAESSASANETYLQVQNTVNNALNTLLNEPATQLFEPQKSEFRHSGNLIEGNMEYSFQDGDLKTPVSFLNELKPQNGDTPTTSPTASTTLQSSAAPTLEITAAPTLQNTAAPTLMGTVLIYIRLVFKNITTLPSETEVLNAANSLLDSSVRMKREVRMQKLNNPVSIQNVTYQKTSSNSYIIVFGFKISNVSISKNIELRNETYDAIQNTINSLLNKILNDPNAAPFTFQRANYTGNDTVIQADAEYVFVEGDIKAPSGFLKEILKVSGLAGGGFPGWALAIIIPCGIAIILVPCWILLCIMLCGCCGAVRRRWHRRQSYNVQYPIHNSLF